MSYTPTNWTTGDTITATKLNKIEQGIANAGSALICRTIDDGGYFYLDHTAQEIYEALLSGTPAYILYEEGDFTVYSGSMYLAPIIAVGHYNYADLIRIVASKPKRQQFDNNYYNYTMGALVYEASSLSDHPCFLKATGVSTSAMVTSTLSDIV